MKTDTQQKIITALSAIQYMSNMLNVVNIEMRLVPSQGIDALAFQQQREQVLDSFGDKIIDIANEMGDYLNNLDAMGEEELSFINPMFDFINEEGR